MFCDMSSNVVLSINYIIDFDGSRIKRVQHKIILRNINKFANENINYKIYYYINMLIIDWVWVTYPYQ